MTSAQLPATTVSMGQLLGCPTSKTYAVLCRDTATSLALMAPGEVRNSGPKWSPRAQALPMKDAQCSEECSEEALRHSFSSASFAMAA